MTNRSHVPTIIAVAICAYAACDMIHEVLGHGTAVLLSRDVRALSLTTVALQTSSSSRWVAAAGTLANLLAGVIALALAGRRPRFDATRFFFLLLGGINFLNAAGYFIFSAVLGGGDWAVVIASARPEIAWRIVMGAVGLVSYAAVVALIVGEFSRLVHESLLAPSEVPTLVFPAYLAGALLLVAGAAMNPISPALILLSGASTGFGAMAGLLFVPGIVENRVRDTAWPGDEALPASRGWIVAGVIVAIVFVFVIGRGIQIAK